MSDTRWTGDLDDDCRLRDGEWLAHVEKMSRRHWWFAVYGPGFELNASEESGAPGECLWFNTGPDARRFCEWLIGVAKAGRLRAKFPQETKR